MGKHEIAELEWENKGERLKLKTRHAVVHAPGLEFSSGHSGSVNQIRSRLEAPSQVDTELKEFSKSLHLSQAVAPVSPVSPPSPPSNEKQVLSPFVGTFYRAPSPDSDPYVREGLVVKRGDVLCVIEAMKLMNEIEAEFPGKIKSVLVENGQPVEFGEPLFMIEI
jgi:acetyl-CoA carboxylase biotin carboxyl carrier protein